ncbi:DUF6680 family protein [Nitrosomonas mobilis]|uniref:Uncharacterized protein n=1 Tax=Nitrosomonas mobilis TaxID=51642 RepID=A0A1G5SBN6_9PROT|nr:DUF6680 family protein [Nitrosomonas mobilis]SCZ84624.1 conserved hypothetical protein [Nitrosomonas mobilis]
MSDPTTAQIFVTLSASLLSGLIGLGISTWHYRRFEVRKAKLDTLKKVISNRYDLQGDEFSRGLNEIVLVFNKSPSVMKALAAFHGKVVTRQDVEDALLALLKSMCTDLGVGYEQFNDSFFLKPFNTRMSSL